MLTRIFWKTLRILSSLAVFALMGSWVANPFFHLHYKYGAYFAFGILLAFVGDALTLFQKADALFNEQN